jgi:hypothetical protein
MQEQPVRQLRLGKELQDALLASAGAGNTLMVQLLRFRIRVSFYSTSS